MGPGYGAPPPRPAQGPGYGAPPPQGGPGYGAPGQGYGAPGQGFGAPGAAYGAPGAGYGAPGGGYGGAPMGGGYYSGRPTVVPVPNFDPGKDADDLRKAMRGLGKIYICLHLWCVYATPLSCELKH